MSTSIAGKEDILPADKYNLILIVSPSKDKEVRGKRCLITAKVEVIRLDLLKEVS